MHDLNRQAAGPLEAAGAEWAESARALAEASDVVLTSLPGPPEVEAVAPELLAGFGPGKVWFDLTTNSPVLIRRLHPAFAELGAELFDAPVSGGPRGARSGKLAVLVGGDKAVFEANRAPARRHGRPGAPCRPARGRRGHQAGAQRLRLRHAMRDGGNVHRSA